MNGWEDDCTENDYRAAESYLTLHFAPETARGLVGRLRYAPVLLFARDDVLRAARVEPILVDGPTRKVPLLLVRSNGRVLIADGFDRLCDGVDGPVPAKIV